MMTWVITIGSLLARLALVFVARPNAQGENPSFVRGTAAEMLYPVMCLGLIVIGLSLLITSF